MHAAVMALRSQHPVRLVIGVPIAPPETCRELALEVDDLISARTVTPFLAVGRWYEDFSQTTDEEVRQLLDLSAEELGRRRQPAAPGP